MKPDVTPEHQHRLTPEDEQQALDKEIAELRANYAAKIPNKVNLIVDLWGKLTQISWNDDAFNVMYRLLHGLSGSGKTFGFEKLSQQCRNIESYLINLLKQKTPPSAQDRFNITQLIKELQKFAQDPANLANSVETAKSSIRRDRDEKSKKMIFIIDDDHELCLYIGMKLQFEGYQTRGFTDVAQALQYMDHRQPDLIILDVMFSNNPVAGFETVQSFRDKAGKKLPVLFISARTDLEARARAIRVGGNAYLTKPFDFSELVSKIDEQLDVHQAADGKILLIDDDQDLTAFYARHLSRAGMNVEVVNKPVELMKKLDDFKPDVVILDVHMPGYDGLELAAVMRQDNRFVGMPIIFLTADSDGKLQERAYGLGANEFVVKPIGGDELTKIASRQLAAASRVKSVIKFVSKKDRFGNTCNNRYFMEQLEIAITGGNESAPFQYLLDIKLKNKNLVNERLELDEIEQFNQILSEQLINLSGHDYLISQFSDTVYMVLTGYIEESTLLAVAKNISEGLCKTTIPIKNKNLKVEVDIGVVEINQNILSIRHLLSEAETANLACHEDKNRRFVLVQLEDKKDTGDADLYDQVRDAMKKGGFQLAYQPIVSMQNRSYETYEVLLRCTLANNAEVLPSRFIPLFQQKKEMADIDRWVVQNAIHNLSADRHARSAVDFMIKISGQSMLERQLIAVISNSIIDGGISGDKRIILLLSENDIVDEIDNAVSFRQQVAKLGCAIGIDHFGATEQSLDLIDLLQPEYVKLHPPLSQAMAKNSESKHRLEVLTKTALENQAEVVACNIEDPMMLSQLWALGIRCFQGYFIKEPNKGLDYDFKSLNLD